MSLGSKEIARSVDRYTGNLEIAKGVVFINGIQYRVMKAEAKLRNQDCITIYAWTTSQQKANPVWKALEDLIRFFMNNRESAEHVFIHGAATGVTLSEGFTKINYMTKELAEQAINRGT